MKFALSLVASVLAAHASLGEAKPSAVNYDESKAGVLGKDYTIPDPLVFADGRKVENAEDWAEWRREMLEIFEREVYGRMPPRPESMPFELVAEKTTEDRFAVERRYRQWFRADKAGPCIDWVVFVPRFAKKPCPVILHLNYNGNDVIASGRTKHFLLPLGEFAARGYAFMSAHYTQITADGPGRGGEPFSGVFELWGKRDPARTDSTGSIMAWAWGLCRGLDLAENVEEIDGGRGVVVGSSRLGKAALLAAAFDERFKVCVANQTGAIGTQLMKRDFGENLSTQRRMFPWWYCPGVWKWTGREREMPFDQHMLLACVAPRALLVEGFDTLWFDPRGEWLSVKAASPAWEFLSGRGVGLDDWPEPYDGCAVDPPLGYVRRTEGHGLSPYDWHWALDFADKALGCARDFSIADFGAEDGAAATEAFARAIASCEAAGGGRVVVPKGTWRTGAVFFRPGVNLHLEKGATILGVDDAEGYPMRETRIEGETCVYYPALVNADGCDGFAITGEGVVDGHGLPTWKAFWEMRKSKPDMLNKEPGLVRPRLLYVSNSKNIDVSGVTFRNSKFWTTHFYRCENVRVHDCEIVAEVIGGVRGPSTDAIDIDVCRGFSVSNVVMDVNDDAVVVKGGKGPEANDYAKFPGNGPSEGILVEDCLFKSVCHSCLTLGSECPAVTNVVMRNCRLEGPGFFVNVKMRDDTPQDYSGILVETCRGRCRKLFNCRAWTQFSAVKDGGEPSRSRLSNFTMRGNKVAAAKPSDTFDDRSFISFSNCRMEDASGIMQAQ